MSLHDVINEPVLLAFVYHQILERRGGRDEGEGDKRGGERRREGRGEAREGRGREGGERRGREGKEWREGRGDLLKYILIAHKTWTICKGSSEDGQGESAGISDEEAEGDIPTQQ